MTLRPTTTSLSATLTSTTNNQQVTLISVVRWTGTTVPTGVVTFTSGGTTLGSATLDKTGIGTLTINVQSTTTTITAVYAGDVSYAASTSLATSVSSGAATQFTLALTPSAMQMQSKEHGTATLTLQSVSGFTDTMQFGCLGLPYAATCTFDQTSLVLKANGTATVNVVIDTGNPLGAGASASNAAADHSGVLLCALPGAFLAGLALFRKRRIKLAALLLLLVALGATVSATGCSGLQVNGTPAGTYSFKVSAQGVGSGASQAQTMTLTVTQ